MNEFVAFPCYWNKENMDIWINKYIINSKDSNENLNVSYDQEQGRYQFNVQYLRDLYINNRTKFNYLNKVMPLYGIYVSVNKGAGIFGDSKIKNGLHYVSSYNTEASLLNLNDDNVKSLMNFLSIQTNDELLGLIVERIIDLMPIINLGEAQADLINSGFVLSKYDDNKDLVKLHTNYPVMALVNGKNVKDDNLIQRHLDYDSEDKQILIPLIFHNKDFIHFSLNCGKIMGTKNTLKKLINTAFLNGKINLNTKSKLNKKMLILDDIFSDSISIGYDLKIIKKAILYEIKNYFTNINNESLINMLNKINCKALLFNLVYFWKHSSFKIQTQLNNLYNSLSSKERFIFNNTDKISLPKMINKLKLNASTILNMQSKIYHQINGCIYDNHILLNVFITSQLEHKDFVEYLGEDWSHYILSHLIDEDNNIRKYWQYQDNVEVNDYEDINSKKLGSNSFHIDVQKAKDVIGKPLSDFIENKLSHQIAFPEIKIEDYIDDLILNDLSQKDSRLLNEANINSNSKNLEVFLTNLNLGIKIQDHLIMPIECNFNLFNYLLDNINDESTEKGVREFFNRYLNLNDISKVLNNPKIAKLNKYRYISTKHLNLDDNCLFKIKEILNSVMSSDYTLINDELINNISLPNVGYDWTPELLVSYAKILGYRKIMWPRKITHFEPNIVALPEFNGDMINITADKVKLLMNEGNYKVINVYDALVNKGILRPQSSSTNKKIPEAVLEQANLISDNGTLVKGLI